MEGLSLDAEAGAKATDVEDLFARLEDSGRMLRVEPAAPATMYRGTMLSMPELDALGRIEDVARLGRVRRIEADRIVLERGEAATDRDVLHIDCTALGLRNAPATPIFQPDRIVLQQVRHNSPTFNSALLGFVEAYRDDDAEKNRICPPNPYPSGANGWPGMMRRTFVTEQLWMSESDIAEWLAESRLDLLRGLPDHAGEPSTQAALERFVTHVGDAVERLGELSASGSYSSARIE